eukprot:10690646-Alexandrium_andersonii.AAC.1
MAMPDRQRRRRGRMRGLSGSSATRWCLKKHLQRFRSCAHEATHLSCARHAASPVPEQMDCAPRHRQRRWGRDRADH